MTPTDDEHDTSRERIVAALSDAPQLGEEHLRLILDALPSPVSYIDADECYRFNNKAHDRWFGRPHSELYGRSLREVFGDRQYVELRPFIERALAGEETVFEQEVEYPDGSLRSINVTCVPEADGAGRVRGFVALIKDLTRRRRAEGSLRLQSQLLDTVEQAVIATDLAGKITYWNRHAEKLYGWAAREVLGRDIVEVTPAEASREQAAEIMSCLMSGKAWSGEFDVRRRDGTTFPASVTDTPIQDESGNLVGIVGVSADITERRRAEEAVREAEKRALREYETLLQRLTHLAASLGTARDHLAIFRDLRDFAVVSVPCAGVFISLYDEARDVRVAKYAWGDDEEVDVSTLPPMPVSAEGPNSRAVRTRQVIITNDYWEMKRKGAGQIGVLVGPDNGLRPQSSLVVPMAVMGRIVGTVEVQSYQNHAYREEHVTAMKMAANLAAVAIENMRLLQFESRAREAAEESNRLKDEFLATLSHELRTPLTAILGWAGMLRDGRLDAKSSATAIEIIERNARTQQQIVDDILDVSRSITGYLRLEAEPTDLRCVVEAAIDTVRPAATAKSIALSAAFEPGVGPIMGDPMRLQQVVWNLLLNAVKFTPLGGEVSVRVGHEGGHARLTVSDTGEGISADFLPHVFDRFRQGDQSTTRVHGGLGLGLSIVRHLVELHGGTVRAESVGEGLGSTFTVELPLLRIAGFGLRNEDQTQGGDGSGGESATHKRQSAMLEGLRVLVVDDEPDALNLIKVVLERMGATVTAVESAAAAWGSLEESWPDLLLCDIGMPGEDGYQFMRRMRALESARGPSATPAIALTAYAGDGDRALALDAGFHLHVPKPVDPADLVSVIAGLVAVRQK
ncbi:MAG TPA: PAS domain S-box protein [Pyrinomonadaceae bacterium]|jgi:PAS domain S-box-containing protein|nr:PAS domain S-box protein [Pyrinomonadaceae bacterium]